MHLKWEIIGSSFNKIYLHLSSCEFPGRYLTLPKITLNGWLLNMKQNKISSNLWQLFLLVRWSLIVSHPVTVDIHSIISKFTTNEYKNQFIHPSLTKATLEILCIIIKTKESNLNYSLYYCLVCFITIYDQKIFEFLIIIWWIFYL